MAELYRYVYIVIFGKHLSQLYWIVLKFLDLQWIVSQEDFQNKILNWSILQPFSPALSQQTSRARKRGQKLWELPINLETAV